MIVQVQVCPESARLSSPARLVNMGCIGLERKVLLSSSVGSILRTMQAECWALVY